VFGAIHHEAGINLVPDDEVVRFEGSLHVERVVTKQGRRIPCDLAIVAVGIQPNVELVKGSGVVTGNGVTVDAHSIQPYYASRVAAAAGMTVTAEAREGEVEFKAA
jgi:NADPH-dependent 2,4-dienoyl-CoA reductase/sulfur reductase-like enzyme